MRFKNDKAGSSTVVHLPLIDVYIFLLVVESITTIV